MQRGAGSTRVQFEVLILFLSAGLTLAVGACGSGGGGGGGGGGDADGGGGGGGGGGADAGSCAPDDACLAPPDHGFQVKAVGADIQPGQDIEYCEVVQLPGDPSDTYYVNKFESKMTIGSHHLIVSAIEPGSATDANAQVGDRVTCFGPADGFGGDLVDVTGQQVPYHEEAFPAGVGRVYHGGQKLVFDYHYLDATDNPIHATAVVNFYTTTADQIEKISQAGAFFFVGINVPPGQTASYDIQCSFDTDVMVYKLTRHTHRWGTDFPVWYAGGPNDGQLIYTSPNYEDPDFDFPQPILMHAGEGFRFECNYDNTDGDHTLTFGEKTSNEMCILFPSIYSPTERELPGQEGCLVYTPNG